MIKAINAREHVRLRPGMYIGSLNMYGFKQLLFGMMQEMADFSQDNIKEIEVTLSTLNLTVFIPDFSVDELIETEENVAEQRIELKLDFNKAMFLFCGIVLSEHAMVEVTQSGQRVTKHFSEGILNSIDTEPDTSRTGTKFVLNLDSEIFKALELDFYDLVKPLFHFSILNPKINITVLQQDNRIVFRSPNGLLNVIKKWKSKHTCDFEVSIQELTPDYNYDINFFLTDHIFPDRNILSFANKLCTPKHGSLINGLFNGVLEAFQDMSDVYLSNLVIDPERLYSRINIASHVSGKDIRYGGNTKDCVDVKEIEQEVQTLTYKHTLKELMAMPLEALKEFLEPFEAGWPYNNITDKFKS